MRKTVNLILAMLFAASTTFATTYEGTWEQFTWSYDDENYTLTLSGEGALPDLSQSVYGPWVEAKCVVITSVVIEEGITAIGAWNFGQGYSAVENLTLASTVESIGEYAFYRAVSLRNIEWSTGLKSIGAHAFELCSTIGANSVIDLPEGLETIGEYAFANTTATGLVIPASVTSIGAYAFYNSNITSVIFEDGSLCEEISEAAFMNCHITEVDFGEDSALRVIGAYAFANNVELTQIIIPYYIEEIGDYAYSGCYNVNYIIIYASNPPTIYANSFPFADTWWWYDGVAPDWFKYSDAITFEVYSEEYKTAEIWETYKEYYSATYVKATTEITTTVESVTITYGDLEVDVDALVETEAEYTVTYAEVDEDGNIIEGTETDEQPTEAGDYVIIYTIDETNTTAETVVEIPLTIDKKDTDSLSNIDPDGYTTTSGVVIDFEEILDLEDPDAEVTVKYYDAEGNEYDEQPTEPGEYTVVITVGDTDNINGGEVETTLTIEEGVAVATETGIDAVEVTTSVKVVAGKIVITTSEELQARVYSISGALVAETTVDGTATISASKGIYLVVLNGKTTKVLVK